MLLGFLKKTPKPPKPPKPKTLLVTVAPRAGLPGAARDAPRQVSAGGFQTSAACAAPAALPAPRSAPLRSAAPLPLPLPLPLGSPGAWEARGAEPPGGRERGCERGEGAAAVRAGTGAGVSRVGFPLPPRGSGGLASSGVWAEVRSRLRSPAGPCPNSCESPAGGRDATRPRAGVCLAPAAAGRWRGRWFPAGFQEKTSGLQ